MFVKVFMVFVDKKLSSWREMIGSRRGEKDYGVEILSRGREVYVGGCGL